MILQGVAGHLALHVLGGDGKAPGAEQTAALLGDEQVILQTDAAEVVVLFLQQCEIDILGIDALLLPFLNKSGDEVDTGLVRYDVAGLEHLAHTQRTETELCRTLISIVITDVVLAEILHIVHVQPHIMAETVGHEKRMSSRRHYLVWVSLKNAEVDKALGHQTGYGLVYLRICDAGTGYAQGQVVGSRYYIVNLLLFRGELTGRRYSPGEVRAVIGI